MQEFVTIRDFNKKFPGKIFICSRCQGMTQNPHQCTRCGNQSTNFLFANNTYSYTIKEYGITETIFKPIEVFRKSDEAEPQTRKSKEHE